MVCVYPCVCYGTEISWILPVSLLTIVDFPDPILPTTNTALYLVEGFGGGSGLD